MSTITIPTTALDLLTRSLDHSRPYMTEDVVRFLLSLELTPEDQQHLHDLAAKARQGSLTASEQKEIDDIMRIGRIVDVLKAKARFSSRKD